MFKNQINTVFGEVHRLADYKVVHLGNCGLVGHTVVMCDCSISESIRS